MKYKAQPKSIEIQTATFCNGKCSICPHEALSKKKKQGVMEQGLFEKIIDQAAQWPKSRVIPYLNNEPFLDPIYFDRLDYIRKKCHDCELEIATNVSLLDKKVRDKLISYSVDDLRLSVFAFNKESYQKVMKGLSWEVAKKNLDDLCEDSKFRESVNKISIVMIDYPELEGGDLEQVRAYCKKHSIELNFWGFLDRNRKVKRFCNNIYKEKVIGCELARPTENMHVLYDGRVILCSMDWGEQYVLGDATQKSLQEIWDSKAYRIIREKIHNEGLEAPEICKKCKISI